MTEQSKDHGSSGALSLDAGGARAEGGAFTFDTRGEVFLGYDRISPAGFPSWRWSDLDAFTQGYVEALFANLGDVWIDRPRAPLSGPAARTAIERPRFSDLAPETLAAILKDCAKASERLDADTAISGSAFWQMRQRGDFVGGLFVWPPLTPYLGDDGKVYLRAETASPARQTVTDPGMTKATEA